MTIVALFVDPKGVYSRLPDVDCWGEDRDARLYAGPHPVVAHPPCSRWCRLAGLVEARWGHKRGEDGGCFASALESVRRWGGVLEHPAYSDAWVAHGLTPPLTGAGWQSADWQGGWTCYVEQWFYGHRAKKATWLYACRVDLPSLHWGHTPDREVTAYVSDGVPSQSRRRALVERWNSRSRQRPQALVSWCGNHVASGEVRERLGKKAAAATPAEFRDVLITMARSHNSCYTLRARNASGF